jgi:polysaccharide export outer membrane protein
MNGWISRDPKAAFAWVAIVACGMLVGGCSTLQEAFQTDKYRFFAPNDVIRPPEGGQSINPILPSIGPADTAQELYPNATFPKGADLEYTDTDYVLGPSDVVNISILDLFYEGVETPLQRTISETGYISLPLVPYRMRAEGLTAQDLQNAIIEAYRTDVLKEPVVSVTIVARRQAVFSMVGAVDLPGRYPIMRRDTRLLDALAMAQGVVQTNIDYIYVIRQSPPVRVASEPSGTVPDPSRAPLTPGELPPLPPEAPAEPSGEALPQVPQPTPPQAVPPAPETEPGEIDLEKALRELGTLEGPQPGGAATQPVQPAEMTPHLTELAELVGGQSGQIPPDQVPSLSKGSSPRFVYTAEGFVRVDQQAGEPSSQPQAALPFGAEGAAAEDLEDPFGWRKVDKAGLSRVIAIDYSALQAGDPLQNIVVRENDIVQVPVHNFGEFYVMGEVLRPGVYSLTARQLTVKQAIAAAGNLGPLAWPKNAVLYRRIGSGQEEVVPLDVEAIFNSQEPDVFLKANDIIAVGSDIRTTFFAVMRNAFRLTYGFGFIYDRNFGAGELNSLRFERW